MRSEIEQLLDVAVRKELEAEAIYRSAQAGFSDPVSQSLLQALAEEEAGHVIKVRELAQKNGEGKYWDEDKLRALRASDLVKDDMPIDKHSKLQDMLRYAIQREKNSVQLYTKIKQALKDKNAQNLCEELLQEELGHEIKLRNMYHDLFYG